jgi:hypothetical protein
MATIFFNGVGQVGVEVLPRKQKMNSAYFTKRILTGVGEMCVREETIRKANLTVHFDRVPTHNPEMVREILTQWNIARMDQPPYSPDLAPCDLFLFGCSKQFLRHVQFSTEQKSVNVIIGFWKQFHLSSGVMCLKIGRDDCRREWMQVGSTLSETEQMVYFVFVVIRWISRVRISSENPACSPSI